MRDYEFLLVVEEICTTLFLSRPTIAYCLELLTLFRESDTHNYNIDVTQTDPDNGSGLHLPRVQEQRRKTANPRWAALSRHNKRGPRGLLGLPAGELACSGAGSSALREERRPGEVHRPAEVHRA